MKKYYVSLVRDLLHYYLMFEAESEEVVREYLAKEYFKQGIWTLPWCSIYTYLPEDCRGVIVPHSNILF